MKPRKPTVEHYLRDLSANDGLWTLVVWPDGKQEWEWRDKTLRQRFASALRRKNGCRLSPVNMPLSTFNAAISDARLEWTDVVMYHGDGYDWLTVSVKSCEGAVIYAVRCINELKNLERQLTLRDAFDPDIGIANRMEFSRQLAVLVPKLQSVQQYQGLLIVTLDNLFDLEVNLGLLGADEWRKSFVSKLKRLLDHRASFYALDVQSVGVLLNARFTDLANCQQYVMASAQRLARSLKIDNGELGDAGFVPQLKYMALVAGEENQTADEIIACRGLVNLESLENTGGVYSFSHPEVTERLMTAAYEQRVHNAVLNGEFYPVLQPKVDMASGHWVGAEVLLRWESSEGPEPPVRFIPVLSKLDMLEHVTHSLVVKMVEQLGSWLSQGLWQADMILSINVSPRCFLSRDLLQTISTICDQTGVPRGVLELEITEELFIADLQDAAEQIARYRELGVRVALDDFGTGFSSLSYLQRLQFDTLKIDRSFISSMLGSNECELLVKVMVDISDGLGMDCIAEGVENAAEASRLLSLGCQYAQGYLYARPSSIQNIHTQLVTHQLVRRDGDLEVSNRGQNFSRFRH